MVREFARLFGLVVAMIAGLMFLLGLVSACAWAIAGDDGDDPGFPGRWEVGLDSGWSWGTGALALIALAGFYVLRPKR